MRRAITAVLIAAAASPASARAEEALRFVAFEKAATTGSGQHVYQTAPGWGTLPDQKYLIETNGDVAVDSQGNVYVNTDSENSTVVFDPSGKVLRKFDPKWRGIHGMTIAKEGAEEFIYAAHLMGHQCAKLKLDGTPVWTLDYPKESGHYESRAEFKPTGIVVAPNGDLFIADGYGKSLVHQYGKDLNYIRTFGGKGTEPGKFNVCHNLTVDRRGEKPLLLICDRENRRLQHFDLDGNFVAVVTEGLRRPCGVSILDAHVAVAELEGRVTILDRDNHPVAFLGDNPKRDQWANNPLPPEKWVEGIFVAPHGIAYAPDGSLYVQDWNKTGRVTKLVRSAPQS